MNKNNKVIALMVTIPSRKNVVKQSIDSIYKQVDEIRIIFNDFEKTPEWICSYSKIQGIVICPDLFAANAVWTWNKFLGYVFMIDDDIIYPHDYVSGMTKRIEYYKRRVVVCVHARKRKRKRKFNDYKKDLRIVHFESPCHHDIRVDIAGVGTSAFHSDLIRPKITNFPDKYFRDIRFAVLMAKHNIPIISIKRKAKWLKSLKVSGRTIYTTVKKKKELYQSRNYIIKTELVPSLERYK